MLDKKRRLSEAEEWLFRLAKDPEQYEKERYIDSINEMNHLIEELEKIGKKTPAADHFAHAKIVNGMKQSKRELAKTQAEYEIFKEYKTRTSISK